MNTHHHDTAAATNPSPTPADSPPILDRADLPARQAANTPRPARPHQENPLAAALGEAFTPKRAVSYIRVSTREQAQRGGAEEGFSLPAQREANRRKAQSIGALIVKEFADRGESARSANRPELQKMLAYLTQDGQIDYVIVHKLDRLARNRADDVEINQAFDKAGVRLISTSENIDQTPGGMLLHGIMSSIAEFYSRNLANEVIKGMGEKARNGGTLGKAPLGYMNVRARDEHGREVRTIALDEERAPLIRLAFTEYATGNWTVRQLAEHLAELGLTTAPSPARPAKPITATRLQNILHLPYYKGVISFQGVDYVGAHEPLVDSQTWQTVQQMLASRRTGERQRTHNHFLKSTAVCGVCGARLLVQRAKNSKGVVYPYFVCARRHRVHDCTFKAVLIDEVEELVAALYQRIQLTTEDQSNVKRYLQAELAQIEAGKASQIRSLTTRRTNVEDKRRRLLHAHYEGAVPLDLLKEEQAQLMAELERIERQLDAYRTDVTATRHVMETVLNLMQDCSRLYTAAPAHLKKLLNQVFFERILVNPRVDDDGTVIMPGTPPSQSDSGNAANDVGQASDQAERQHTDVASPCMSDELAAWSVPEGGGHSGMTRKCAGMVCPTPLLRVTSGSNGTTLTAYLRFPFTYLASPALRRVATQDAVWLNKQKAGAQLHQQNIPILTGKCSPRHSLPYEAVPFGCCSYMRVLVHRLGLEPRTH